MESDDDMRQREGTSCLDVMHQNNFNIHFPSKPWLQTLPLLLHTLHRLFIHPGWDI